MPYTVYDTNYVLYCVYCTVILYSVEKSHKARILNIIVFMDMIIPLLLSQEADFKNNKTTKQESHLDNCCFLVEQLYSDQFAYRKGEKILYLLSISRNKIVHQENNNHLDEILFSLFYCF